MIKFLKSTAYIWVSFLFAAGFCIFVLASHQYRYPDPDGYYHAKVAQLLGEGKLTDAFTWLPFTTWGQFYADQHYFYHWLLIPFSTVEWLPWSVIVFATLMAMLFVYVLKKLEVSYWFIWLIFLLIGSVDFTLRILLVKANALSLIFLFLATLILIWDNKQPKNNKLLSVLLGILSFVFVWSYGGFVFLPVLIGIYCLVSFWYKRFSIRLLIAMCFGMLLGVLFHPHHAHIIKHLHDQIFETGLLAGRAVPAGNEWLAYNLDYFFKTNAVIVLLLILSWGVIVWKFIYKKSITVMQAVLFFISIFLTGLTLWHRRFVEYWTPFALIYCAVMLEEYVRQIDIRSIVEKNKKTTTILMITVSIFALAGWAVHSNYKILAGYFKNAETGYEYKRASGWIAERSEEGDIVLNTQWDQFPQLFYWNDKNRYIIGMDPTFMYLYDATKYWQWRIIADDEPEDWVNDEDILAIIQEDLHAKFIFVDNQRNPNVINYINTSLSSHIQESYDDGKVTVFLIK